MGKLVFRVASDWQEVVRLRTEIEKLKQTLLSMDSTQSPDTFKKLNVQLGESTKKMNILISDAAKVGATMENDFKKGIYDGEKAVNSLSEEIIKQKNIIRETQNDVSMLTEQYKKLGKYDPKRQSLSDELNRAKAALGEQKYALGELQSQQALARLSTKALKDEYALFKDESKAVITVNEGVGVSFKKTLAAIGGIAMLKQVASNVVSTAGMFQKYESVLTNALNGSSDKAKAYLSDINSFAAKTNFQLNELTDDFIKFVNRGVTPSMDAMRKMGDFTNTVAKPFDQLTEAILDINNPERWKEFGVRVQTEGNKVKLSFRDMTVECDRTVESVMKAVEQFGSMKGVEGSTEAISKTIEGQMSNLEDTITTALAEIGLANQDLFSGSISAVDTIVKNYGIIGKSVLALVEIYGVYRAGLLINTIVEQGSVKSIWAKITATKAATVAQAAYNKVLMMNPYVLAGAAVVSLGIAMWTLADNTSIAEKAQERFNKKQEEAAKQEQERKQKIESLIQSSRDIALADLQRGQSLAELRKEYPKIFAQYDIETIKLADILKLKQQIAEEEAKRAGEKRAKEFSDIESEIKYYENLLKSLSGQQGVDGYVKKLKELRAERDVMLQEKGKGISEQFISNLKDVDISEFDRYISDLEKRIKGKGENGKIKIKLPIDTKGSLSDEAIYDVKDIKTLIETTKAAKKTKEEAAKAEKKSSAEWLASYKKAYEDTDKAYKDFLSSKTVMSDADRDKELKRLKGLRDTAKATYETKGGSTTTDKKEETAAEKLRQQQEKYNLLLDKQALDRKRQQEDLETQLTQSKIDAMSDGFLKEQEQRDLNNKKEIQSIKRQKEDFIRAYIQAQKEMFDAQEELKAKQTKGYVRESFDSSSISVDTSAFDAIIDNTSKRQQNDKLREQEDSWDEYLIKYGTFQGKKAALTRKYEKLIASESDAGKAALLQKEFEDALSALDVDKLKQDINWELVFGDLSKVSKKELDKVNVQLKNFRKSSEYQNMTVEQKKVIDEALDSIQSAIIDKGGILGDLPDQLDNLRKAQDELQRAQDEYNESLENGTLAEQENAKKKQNFAEQNLSNAAVNVEKSKNKAINNITAITNAISQLGNAEVSLSDFGSVVGTLVDVLSQSGTKIGGLIASVLSLLDVVGEKGTLNFAEDLVSNIFESLRKALAKDTQQIVKLHTFGLLDIDLMGPDGTAYYEGIKEQLEAINKVYEKIIANSKEGIQFGEGFAAIESASTALDNYNKKVENLQKIADASGRAGASWNHHSAEWHSNKNVGVENFSQMGGIIDKSIQSMDDLYYLSGDELYLLMTQMPEAWSAIDGRIRENLENIINCKDEANELKDALNQAMTGIDQDSFYNGFIDQLSDMDTSFEDMCDNFEGYLRKSIISGLIASQYKARIDGLYEQWSEAAKSDKEITEDESGILQQTYKEIIEDMMKDREQMAKGFGWDSSSSSQSSTSKGFQAMSQDTGEELNGRFTALQIAGEEIKNQNNIQSQSLNLLTAKADAILSVNTETRNIADDTRDLIAQSYLELVQISENTGAIVKPIIQMQKDMAEVKNNTKGLSSK